MQRAFLKCSELICLCLLQLAVELGFSNEEDYV